MKSFLILSLFFTVSAFANVTINSVTNASNTVQLGTKYIPEILGGISGSSKCSGQTTTINSCEMGNDRSACNYNTICPTTKLTINLKSGTSGNLLLVDSENYVVADFGPYKAGENVAASIPWTKICNVTSQDATCSKNNGKSALKIGVDTNGDGQLEDSQSVRFQVSAINNTTPNGSLSDVDGVDDYNIQPGNKRAFVMDFSTVQDFYVFEAAKIVGVRGFYTPATCANPLSVTTASESTLLNINDDKNEIIDNRIEGLQNGVRYLFMFGFQDEAGNIGLFKDLTLNCVDDKHSVMPR